MKNNLENIEEVELKEQAEDEMGPEEREEDFGIPSEDEELVELEEEE